MKPRGPAAWALHLACAGHAPPSRLEDLRETEFRDDLRGADKLLSRLAPHIDLRSKSVLEIGCGHGSTSIAVGRAGARRVLGVDIRPVDLPQKMLRTEFADLGGTVEFRQIGADGSGLGDERFDVILSKDTFEHVADPDRHVSVMESHLAARGEVVIAFGPLWKSPRGGHLWFMTSMPWVQLVFPEEVILAERQRFRPWEAAVDRLEDVPGGLNRMTLARFEAVMSASPLECRTYEVDHVGMNRRGAMGMAFSLPARIGGLREYLAGYVFSLWHLPAGSSSTMAAARK